MAKKGLIKILKVIEYIGKVIFFTACFKFFIFVFISCVMVWSLIASQIELSINVLHSIEFWLKIITYCVYIIGFGIIYFIIKYAISQTKKSHNSRFRKSLTRLPKT